MQFSHLLVALIALAGTPLFLILLRPAAKQINLIDHPDQKRKHHNGSVPLTGGIAILLSLLLAFSLNSITSNDLAMSPTFWPVIGLLLTFLVMTHAIDDILDLNATARLFVDGTLALCICTWAMVKIATLGELFGMGEVTLGRFGVAMTVFSFIAASNAFNMTDGIDSLCTGFGLIAFTTLMILLAINGDPSATPLINVLGIIVFALVPMYLANLGRLGIELRSFLGDSGARLIGFVAAITVIMAASQRFIDPVFAFFPIAIPVCDCLVLMAVRSAEKRSPFSADRLHLHHLLVDNGLSTCQARRAELGMGVVFAAIGIALHASGAREWVVTTLVVSLFAGFIALRFWLAARARTQPLVAPTRPATRFAAGEMVRMNIGGGS